LRSELVLCLEKGEREVQLCQEAKRGGLLCWSRDGSGPDTGAEQASPAEPTWCSAGWGTAGFLMAGDRKFIIAFQDPWLLVRA